MWTESEPVAEGVRPPLGREWYKRVKVRFDWVDSQGVPWWEQPSAIPPKITNLAIEVAQSPEAKRVTVTELLNTYPGLGGSEKLQRTDTAISFASNGTSTGDTSTQVSSSRVSTTHKAKEKDVAHLGPVDPLSGLLTPPITPRDLSVCRTDLPQTGCGPGDVPSTPIIGSAVASGSRPMRRRLPGDYALASFGESTTLDTDANHVYV